MTDWAEKGLTEEVVVVIVKPTPYAKLQPTPWPIEGISAKKQLPVTDFIGNGRWVVEEAQSLYCTTISRKGR